MAMARLNQEEGRYRVLLIGIGENTQEEKEFFSQRVSETYSIPFPLLKKIVNRCPIILKKNLSDKKAEVLAKTLRSFGATVSVEERRNFPPVSLEFQGLVPYRVALESVYVRKTPRGLWSLIGRVRNISDEILIDTWVLAQLFDDLEEFIGFEETPLPINPLPAGEISPFKVILDGDLFIRRVSVAFKDVSGELVPTLDRRKRTEWVSVEIGNEPPLPSPAGSREKFDPVELAEISEEKAPVMQKDIHSEPLFQESETIHPLLLGGEARKDEKDTGEIFQESNSLSLEPPEEILELPSGSPEVDLCTESLESKEVVEEGIVGEEAAPTAQPEETAGVERVSDGPKLTTEEEVAEASRFDASAFEEAPRLLEDISERPGEVRPEEESGKEVEEQLAGFSWIEQFRDAARAFYQKPRDIFSIWFEECRKEGQFRDHLHALLTILVHSRFDQGSQSVKALENTQSVFHLIVQPNLRLDEIPPLEGTLFISGEVWRELFHRALPKVQQIGNVVFKKNRWKGYELERLIQVIPHMGHRNSRTAIRWFNELIPDVIQIDFSDTPVAVDESFYRVVSRLGIVDPHFDRYQGGNSMADAKIQSFSRMAYPQNPLDVEGPMGWMGRAEEQGGHCLPVQPRCKGCLFESFCPKLYVHFDPSEKGMRE